MRCLFCGVLVDNWNVNDSVFERHLNASVAANPNACQLLCRRSANNIPIDEDLFYRSLPPIQVVEEYIYGYNSRLLELSMIEDDDKTLGYEIESRRIKSFPKWFKWSWLDPKEVSSAGFYFNEDIDSLVCFSCDEIVTVVAQGTDIWQKHDSECCYVKVVKGESYKIQSGVDAIMEENAREDIEEDDFKDSKKNVCVCCFDEEVTTLLYPCKHAILCGTCSFGVKTCPKCRIVIEKREKIFL